LGNEKQIKEIDVMNHCHFKAIGCFLGPCLALLSVGALPGCEGQVTTVGEAEDTSAKDETGETSAKDETGETSAQETKSEVGTSVPGCEDQDALVRSNYDTWLASDNDFEDEDLGSLVGKTFEGYIEGGDDISLIIDADGSAVFFVGERVDYPVTDKDKGYLCGPADTPEKDSGLCISTPMEGVAYEVRGASLDRGRLLVPIQEASPYDPWCKQQTPVLDNPEDEGADPPSCTYALIPNEGVTFRDGECKLGGRPYDCGWLQTALIPVSTCTCTTAECFADVGRSTDLGFDARVDDSLSEITGTLSLRGDGPTIYLFEVTD